MRQTFATTVLVVFLSAILLVAGNIDPRLATVHKVFIVAADELSDDQGVAVCLADRLTSPIEVVKEKSEADVLLVVKAHIPGGTSRVMLGVMGGSPSANLEVQLLDGTKLWSDGAKYRKGSIGTIGAFKGASEIQCGLANELVNTLRDGMRKARDAAKK